jgi:excisionase family DNA binding protein
MADDVQKQLEAEGLIFDNNTLNIKPMLSDMATQLKIERLQNQLLQQPQSSTLRAANPDGPLSVVQMAKRLGVAPDTIRKWIASGELKAINYAKPGKRPRYRIEATALADFERRRSTLESQPRERRPRKSKRAVNLFSSRQETTGEQTPLP